MKTGSVSSGYTGYAYSSDEETPSYNAESFQSSSPGRRASEWLSQLSLSPPRAHNLPPRISAPKSPEWGESSSRLTFSASTRHSSVGGRGEPKKTGRNADMKRSDDANKGAEHLYAQYKGAPLPEETVEGLTAGYLARDGSPTTGRMTIDAYNGMAEDGHKPFKDKTPRMSWR
ncbi:RS_T3E_Hyp7-effector family protein [Ralstonia solanacearum]|nr:RS_T3E_Hyp7-effector family protein [Ralstonia solanacearum]NKA49785.1 RS_T3E_Hyp7-effector family protein [Ralstonia solanacearum]